MSKSYIEQVETFMENGLSERAAKEAAAVCNCYDENDEGQLMIYSDFSRVIKFFKRTQQLNELESITATKIKSGFELRYLLCSNKNCMNFYTRIIDSNQSISHLYSNAAHLEELLDEEFNILFYPAK